MFGLSLLVFRDRLVGGSDGHVLAESKEQGVIPVATFIHATPRPLIPDQVRNDEGVGLTTRASGGALASDAGDFRCADE